MISKESGKSPHFCSSGHQHLGDRFNTPESLHGKQVLCICNFPEKQIGQFISQVFTCGFSDEEGWVVLAVPDLKVPNGAKLF